MLNRKESDNATRASIKKEMAKPRMAKSVRTAELNLDAERDRGQARTTVSGTVDKIITSLRTTQSEKVQIAVAGADDSGIEISVLKNTLTDGNGGKVRLKKRAHVEVTFTAKPRK